MTLASSFAFAGDLVLLNRVNCVCVSVYLHVVLVVHGHACSQWCTYTIAPKRRQVWARMQCVCSINTTLRGILLRMALWCWFSPSVRGNIIASCGISQWLTLSSCCYPSNFAFVGHLENHHLRRIHSNYDGVFFSRVKALSCGTSEFEDVRLVHAEDPIL